MKTKKYKCFFKESVKVDMDSEEDYNKAINILKKNKIKFSKIKDFDYSLRIQSTRDIISRDFELEEIDYEYLR